jgi:CubicO group peptidase (beta-lactamase class C family)
MPIKSEAIQNGANKSLFNNNFYEIDGLIKNNMIKGKIPGLSVVVVKGDKTIYSGNFGYSIIKSRKQVTSNTLFELGSTSKAFTALGILKLAKDGLINLNTPVDKYIPWLKLKYKDKFVSVTIEQLLHHTSGIPFKTIDKISEADNDNALEQTVRKLIGIELDTEPGKVFQYASINYDILGLVIQYVTKESYENYMTENVLKALRLNNTYVFKKGIKDGELAKGYKISFLRQREYNSPSYRGNKPAGYIISNSSDMARWLRIQLGTETEGVIDKNIIKQSHEPNYNVAPENGSYYAAGWFVSPNTNNEKEISHEGSNPNYSSYVILIPKDNIGIAILCNTNSNYIDEIGDGIKNIILGEEGKEIALMDFNIACDNVSICIIFISMISIIITIFFIGKLLKELFERDRKFGIKNNKRIVMVFFLTVMLIGLIYIINKIPYYFYSGVSWSFAYIWLPVSSKLATFCLISAIFILYLLFILNSISFRKNEILDCYY